MRDYGKVHSSFWTSQTTRSLSDDGRMLALYLITSPHSTISGVFRLPDGYVCEDLQWSTKRVAEGFAELLLKGFANRCETTKWVWIVKHFEWNKPENPNQFKSAKKIAESVPAETSWRADFMRSSGEFLGIEQAVEKKPLLNPSATLTQSGTGTGAGTGANKDSVPDGTGSVEPVDEIFALGLPILIQAGLKDQSARSMLGMFRKQNPDAKVVAAIRQCVIEKPIQPIAWLQAALAQKAGARVNVKHEGGQIVEPA